MTFLFYIVICFLLLQFMKEANERLYSIVAISIIFVLLQLFIAKVMTPFYTTFLTVFRSIPSSGLLLSSLFLVFLGEFLVQVLEQFELKPLQVLVRYSVGITLSLLWLEEVMPFIEMIEQYVVKGSP